jgi:hypothetical protein
MSPASWAGTTPDRARVSSSELSVRGPSHVLDDLVVLFAATLAADVILRACRQAPARFGVLVALSLTLCRVRLVG